MNLFEFAFLFVFSGQWECKEGETEVTFTEMPWYPGQPDSNGGDQDCAALSIYRDPSGKWVDLSCDNNYYTVCKQPLHEVSPTLHL